MTEPFKLTRRSFMGAILAIGTAPAIVRAESLMKIVVPRPLITDMEHTWVHWIYRDKIDCLPQYAYAGAKCLMDGVQYASVLKIRADQSQPELNAALLCARAEHELRRALLSRQ